MKRVKATRKKNCKRKGNAGRKGGEERRRGEYLSAAHPTSMFEVHQVSSPMPSPTQRTMVGNTRFAVVHAAPLSITSGWKTAFDRHNWTHTPTRKTPVLDTQRKNWPAVIADSWNTL